MVETVNAEKFWKINDTGTSGKYVHKIKCPYCGMVQEVVGNYEGLNGQYCLLCRGLFKIRY